MKYKLIIAMLLLSSCGLEPQMGREILSISQLANSQCVIYTSSAPSAIGVIGPCGLYKVGDTLRLTNIK